MSTSAELKIVFDTLYKQYYAMVLQMCLGYMKGDRDLAKDIAQEIFINIWNALEKFKGESSYKTWVYRITVNTCLLYIRNNVKKQTDPLEDASQLISLAITHNENEKKYNELYRAIGELPELDRLIIMMLLEELEYNEISKITGINPVHLRVKIHRIKSKMKQLLNKEYHG